MEPAERIDDPSTCVVRLGERVGELLAELLNPVDMATYGVVRLPVDADVELHYHDFDEYWLFVEGHPRVTLRTPTGRIEEFVLGPGDMVACVRGVEHTLRADRELVYFQYISAKTGGERPGHLIRQV